VIAIPVWNDEVATTLDFARRMLVVTVEARREIARQEVAICDEPAAHVVRRLQEVAVRVLLCGAISEPLARAVVRAGIRIVPYVSGPVDGVLAAYLCGQLVEPRFLQPGCRPGARRRWRHRGGHCGRICANPEAGDADSTGTDLRDVLQERKARPRHPVGVANPDGPHRGYQRGDACPHKRPTAGS